MPASPPDPRDARRPGPRRPLPEASRGNESLREAAEAACAHSREVMADVLRRRQASAAPTREQMELIEATAMRIEMAQSRREMRRADLETLRRQREEAREAAQLERWVRGRVAAMLTEGWTREELAQMGIDEQWTGPGAV